MTYKGKFFLAENAKNKLFFATFLVICRKFINFALRNLT